WFDGRRWHLRLILGRRLLCSFDGSVWYPRRVPGRYLLGGPIDGSTLRGSEHVTNQRLFEHLHGPNPVGSSRPTPQSWTAFTVYSASSILPLSSSSLSRVRRIVLKSASAALVSSRLFANSRISARCRSSCSRAKEMLFVICSRAL